jgi:hypothetical protein
MIEANPTSVHLGATCLVAYQGTPWVSVLWLVTGPGTVDALSSHTDERGVAYCKVSPTGLGTINVQVVAGA